MLKFYTKVIGQQLLSKLPRGRSIYRWFQNNINKSIQPTESMVQSSVNAAQRYLQVLEDLGDGDLLKRGAHLDIGAGYHFTIPLMFYELGCNNQLLVDIQHLARSDSVFPVIDLLSRCNLGKRQVRTLPDIDDHDLDSYLAQLGIEYKAPVNINGRESPVLDNSISVVTMTSVLQYVPRSVVRQIFETVARVLMPGGYFLAIILMNDQYSHFDQSLSRFNFLRYSEKVWERWYCSEIFALNRMRASDFAALFEELPFKAAVWDVVRPTNADYQELNRIKLSSDFARYNREDLASTLLLSAMKRD